MINGWKKNDKLLIDLNSLNVAACFTCEFGAVSEQLSIVFHSLALIENQCNFNPIKQQLFNKLPEQYQSNYPSQFTHYLSVISVIIEK